MDLSRFLGKRRDADADLTPEQLAEQEAAAKAERAEFHRLHVRNGPSAPRFLTQGQLRRQAKRDKASARRKATKRYHKSFRENAWRTRVLEAQLKAVKSRRTGAESKAGIKTVLQDSYGSVAAAQRHLDAIHAEQARH